MRQGSEDDPVTIQLLGCVRCGAGLEVNADQMGYTCSVCDTVAHCYSCSNCARAQCLPATMLVKNARCVQCGVVGAIGAWTSRPMSLAHLPVELQTADHYRRVVAGLMVSATGIASVTPNALCTLTFGPEQLDIAAPAAGRFRSAETIDYRHIDCISVTRTGPHTDTVYADVTLIAGHRQLVLRTETFDASALDELLSPVRIRIDTSRRVPHSVAAPVLVTPTAFEPPLVVVPPASPSDGRKWAIAGGVLALAAGAILLAAVLGGNGSTPDQPGRSSAGSVSTQDDGTSGGVASWGSGPQQPSGRTLSNPALVPGPDGSVQKESCPSGDPILAATGWPMRSGRGTTMTSCQFARNVGEAYWRTGPPTDAARRVVAAGAVPCALGGNLCQNGLFVMNCRVVAGQDWITCEGGKNAVVYLYGQ